MLNRTLSEVHVESAGPSISDAGAGVRPPDTTPPQPRVESRAAAATSVEWARPSAPAGPESDRAATRRRTGMLVAVASSIVLLVAVGVAAWYFMRDPGQGTATPGPGGSGSASNPSVTTAPSGSPSKSSAAEDPTGLDILAHRGGDEKYPLQTLSPSLRRPTTASRWKPTCVGPATTGR